MFARSMLNQRVKSIAHKAFEWQKLVTPQTSASFINRMKEIDTKLTAIRQEIASAPKKVDPIDFSEYERTISAKHLVAQLKKEYEAHTYVIKGENLKEINDNLDKAIERTTANIPISEAEIKATKEQLLKVKAMKANIHNWTLQDAYDAFPGLEQQLYDEYMNGDYIPSEAEERAVAQDMNELRKAAKSGTLQDDPSLPNQIGEWSFEAEQKRADELMDKMFGDSPVYQQLRAKQLAEREKLQKSHH